MSTSERLVPLPEVKRFIVDCLMKVGANRGPALEMAELLAAADYRGHYSHGMNRVDRYVNDIQKKIVEPNATPVILQETEATALVDGRNALGATVGNFCMKVAMEKAHKSGVGWVVARGSNHYGIAGWYAMQAMEKGLMGLSFSNASPSMTPTRAKDAAMGANPLAVAAPAKDGDAFVLDMATTAVAVGKVEVQKRKGESIPEGWALDFQGKNTTDPDEALRAGKMLPVGGLETTSGYKGYGLSMAVELFCGILGGALFGPNIGQWFTNTTEANLGQCFIAIDPECFAPGFGGRLSELMNYLRNMEPINPSKPVLVPGDPERIHMKLVDEEGGIRYHENQIKAWMVLAKTLGVNPINVM
ncbi:uncharacterized oxidoreductase YjmC [Anabrus simplex]|uniref:uncharacterized oxidoreductase YjmC n=1 Tax=Anabrus simplex TaxID=316456 RepID=UPI0035A343E4